MTNELTIEGGAFLVGWRRLPQRKPFVRSGVHYAIEAHKLAVAAAADASAEDGAPGSSADGGSAPAARLPTSPSAVRRWLQNSLGGAIALRTRLSQADVRELLSNPSFIMSLAESRGLFMTPADARSFVDSIRKEQAAWDLLKEKQYPALQWRLRARSEHSTAQSSVAPALKVSHLPPIAEGETVATMTIPAPVGAAAGAATVTVQVVPEDTVIPDESMVIDGGGAAAAGAGGDRLERRRATKRKSDQRARDAAKADETEEGKLRDSERRKKLREQVARSRKKAREAKAAISQQSIRQAQSTTWYTGTVLKA